MKKYFSAMIIVIMTAAPVFAWFDETHISIAKAAGYQKWYNAAAADIARVKLGKREGYNHYHNSPKGTLITPDMVLREAQKYDQPDSDGHLYGAIVGALRAYLDARRKGLYADNYFAYVVHYIGDLSMPLHHTLYNDFNKKNHHAIDGTINEEVLDHIDAIHIYEINIRSEEDLASEIARIANLSKTLGHTLENENRLLTSEEAYRQISHSASLLKGVLAYVHKDR